MNLKTKYITLTEYLIVLYLFFSAVCQINGQEKAIYDSLLRTESSQIFEPSIIQKDTVTAGSGIDTVISYTSTDSIIYSIKNRKMMLYGSGNIKYRLMELKSERININWDTAILDATGIVDTSDTSGVKFTGNPIMIDAGEEFHGHKLLYNFKTQKGNITLADTKADDGFYYGSKVKKIDRYILFIKDGKYTTCDKEHPHFYFMSPRMKLIVKDKVIAEPIYFYIADVPVFALPFGVFPSKGGRRSGFFAPAYGEDATRGRFLKRIGYFWAMSDYTDIALHGDWYTNGSYLLNTDFKYILRYEFSGGISGTYKRFIAGEKGDPNYLTEEGYHVQIRHNQEINPTMRADVNFSFMSNNNFRLTNNLYEALQQSIYSNATLSKVWEGTSNSGSINISRTQTLTNGRIDEILPAISFNRSQTYPFRRKNAVGELNWYEQIGYNYNSQFSHSRTKVPVTVSNIRIGTQNGSLPLFGNVEDFRRDTRLTLNQGTSISISPKFGYFTVTPNFSFRDERTQINSQIPSGSKEDSTLINVKEEEHFASGFLSTGVSTSTRLYGIIQPNILGVNAFRHTLSPNLGLTYSKQIYGTTIGRKQMLANLEVGNLFEMKLKPKSGEEERKIQLLNVNAGMSYNFSADSLNFSNIGVSYRTSIGELLNFSGFSSFSLYQFNETTRRAVNKFLINEGKLARLENFSISLSTSLSGERKKKEEVKAKIDTLAETQSGYFDMYQREEPDFSLPWQLSFSWNFSESFVPTFKNRSANISASLDFNLTESWKFRVSGNYDLIRKEISAPSVQIDRDLHCWVMNFSWVPIGYYRHYRLEIRVKASQLQDVKITKQRTTY